MAKILKNITLGDKEYIYTENKDKSTSVDGYRFGVSEDVREYFRDTGGFVRDMFEPLQNECVKEVIILFIEVPIKGQLVGIYFKTEDGLGDESRLTRAGRFIETIKGKLSGGVIDFEVVNTLEEVYKNPDYGMGIFLNEYINPEFVDDTGFYIGGDMVNFGEKLETVDKNSVREVVEYLAELDDRNLVYKDLDISKIDFIINEPNPFGLDVKLTFRDSCGGYYTNNYESLLSELGRVPTEEEYREFIERYELEVLYEYAVDLNRKLSMRAKRGLTGVVDKDYRDMRIERMVSEFERELSEIDNLNIYISYMLMRELLEKCLIKTSELD